MGGHLEWWWQQKPATTTELVHSLQWRAKGQSFGADRPDSPQMAILSPHVGARLNSCHALRWRRPPPHCPERNSRHLFWTCPNFGVCCQEHTETTVQYLGKGIDTKAHTSRLDKLRAAWRGASLPDGLPPPENQPHQAAKNGPPSGGFPKRAMKWGRVPTGRKRRTVGTAGEASALVHVLLLARDCVPSPTHHCFGLNSP